MQFPYVDTHCHLDSIYERLKKNPPQTFEDFVATFPPGFEGCVNVFSESFESSMKFIGLNHPLLYGALGIHPHNAVDYDEAFENRLIELLKHPHVRALGEIGLDYHYMNSPREKQMEIFERQVKLGVSLGMPIVIHTREADDDTLDILRRAMPKDHVFHIHCYTGSAQWIQTVLSEFSNCYVGFTGVITFKSSDSIREAVSVVPLNRMLSETDGPFMAPIPFRGKPATPAHIPVIINKIAEIKKEDPVTVAAALRENCRTVYRF